MTSSTNEVTPNVTFKIEQRRETNLKNKTEQISPKQFDYLCGVNARGDFYTRYKKSLGK